MAREFAAPRILDLDRTAQGRPRILRFAPWMEAAELADRIASWILGGPLTLLVAGLCAFQLATWIPHFLTWPFFVDHDVFSTLAFGWDSGLRPYRDLRENNFPGTIYLFWSVGKVFGWGRTAPVFALDAAFVIAFGAAMILWSRRRLGRPLAGVIGYASFLSYYLSLDYRNVLQKDWHGPCFIMLGLMIADGWSTRRGRAASALCAAAAFVIRPQVILLAPALVFRIARGDDRRPWSPREAILATAGWAALAAGLTVLAFLPLWLDGTWPDFLGCVRAAAYGSSYNQFTPSRMFRVMMLQCTHWHYLLIPFSIILVASSSGVPPRASIAAWLIALAGAWFYKPISPVAWPYLTHPYVIVLSMNAAILIHVLLEAGIARPSLRLCAILLAMPAAGIVARPDRCAMGESRRALTALRRGGMPEEPPLGYIEPGSDLGVASYPWRDYRAVLIYLRCETSPGTRVANLLRDCPALTGPAARLPVLPAQSLAWLVVKPDDEGAFIASVEDAGEGTLVVWAPAEENRESGLRLAATVRHLAPVVRRYYEPMARFGEIEVWRRKGAVESGSR
jgi:hypothetical protein